MPTTKPLDIDDISEVFLYDPDTGHITWMQTRGKGFKGGRAGTKNHEGYIRVNYKGQAYKAHRLAWALHYKEQPPAYIDHENGIRDDNRIANLRRCKNKDNCRNTATPKNNSTGYKGVCVCGNPKAGRFRAYISPNGRQIHIGVFGTPEEAALAYNREAVRLFGPFAKVNDVRVTA